MGKYNVLMTGIGKSPCVERMLQEVSGHINPVFVPPGRSTPGRLADIDIVYGHLTPAEVRLAPRLKWIQSHATGVDPLMFPELVESRIIITGLGNALSPVVAEHAIALLFALIRNIHLQRDHRRERRWRVETGREIAGITLGILGFGRIGREIACKLRGFDMDIIALDICAHDKPDYVRWLTDMEHLPAFLGQCDAVICCLPATPHTRKTADAGFFNNMKEGSWFVNISRGSIVDEPALVQAVRSGSLRGAGIDVTDPEPCPAVSPLWTEPGILLTPHSAGYSHKLTERKIGWFVQNIRRFVDNKPLSGEIDKTRGW